MKPACRTIGRERQRLEDLAPNDPISEEGVITSDAVFFLLWVTIPDDPVGDHPKDPHPERGWGGGQYSLANMIVRTRFVTAGSAAFREWADRSRSK